MEMVKENFRKRERVHKVYLDYLEWDKEGNPEVCYQEIKVNTVLYVKNEIDDKLDEMDNDLYYDYELIGKLKKYYKNGNVVEEDISDWAIHDGYESYYHKRDMQYINEYTFESAIYNNLQKVNDNMYMCNLDKIELYWTEIGEIEISEYECEHCREMIELRSDELNSCSHCCCNCCPDCLTDTEYGWACPECYEEIKKEIEEEDNKK